jgi:hypothetical protein
MSNSVLAWAPSFHNPAFDLRDLIPTRVIDGVEHPDYRHWFLRGGTWLAVRHPDERRFYIDQRLLHAMSINGTWLKIVPDVDGFFSDVTLTWEGEISTYAEGGWKAHLQEIADRRVRYQRKAARVLGLDSEADKTRGQLYTPAAVSSLLEGLVVSGAINMEGRHDG